MRYEQPAQKLAFLDRLITQVRQLAGAQKAGLVTQAPGTGYGGDNGRTFREGERLGSKVVIISDLMAKEYFPGEDPLGRHLRANLDGLKQREYEIVGVVGDKYEILDVRSSSTDDVLSDIQR